MSLSPMMQQYQEAKQAAGDALLLFRMGDFYELFHDDAKEAAQILGLTLTTRDKGDPSKGKEPTAMAGFPHHQLEGYIGKILRAGRRAAVCDQVEDPKQAKGLVRREVTRIVSAGTVTDDELLDPQTSNYLAAVAFEGKQSSPDSPALVGLAWVEVSTGQFFATTVNERQLVDQLARVDASECLVAEEAEALLPGGIDERMVITKRPARSFGFRTASETLRDHFQTKTLAGFGFEDEQRDKNPRDLLAISAAGAVIDYLRETQRASLSHLDRLSPAEPGSTLEIDAATWRSLEVTRTIREGRRNGALLGVIDRTVTSVGARMLCDWLRRPLTDVSSIEARLEAVGEFVNSSPLANSVREQLKNVYDLERLVARVMTGRASPRDLSCIARTLKALPELKAKLTGRASQRLVQLEERIDLCPEVRSRLDEALADDCPLTSREGGYIRDGYSVELDECRQLMVGGKQWMADYQAEQMESSGIPSIKVGFNKVFGYYLEVTHAHKDKVPENFIRKQTLKNAERYITPELKEYEEKVLSAEDRAFAIEYKIFVELRDLTASVGRRLLVTAAVLAELDVLAGLAELARSRNYCRPEVSAEPVLEIVEGRHPVLDLTEPDGTFVPNGVRCQAGHVSNKSDNGTPDAASLLLITGPNMAGKSTYIRQTALITLMAQIGSFVPAKRATIGVADRLFARVGASDELSRGQSTFMVEMTETARILNTATERSLVILDEIGRGTSTYDGLSLAWAITEHLHDVVGCRTMFATHYHELTDLADRLPGVGNRSVAVREHDGSVVFLHQIVDGPADKSYGIHVAQLAGVPRAVNDRAAAILAELETSEEGQSTRQSAKPSAGSGMQLTLFETAEHPLLEELRSLDVDRTTPMEAFELLQAWRQRILAER